MLRIVYRDVSVECSVVGGVGAWAQRDSGKHSDGGVDFGFSDGRLSTLVAAVTGGIERGVTRRDGFRHDAGAVGTSFDDAVGSEAFTAGVRVECVGGRAIGGSCRCLGGVEVVQVVGETAPAFGPRNCESRCEPAPDVGGRRDGADFDCGRVRAEFESVRRSGTDSLGTEECGEKVAVVSERTVANRIKRMKNKARKQRRRDEVVPEWRRKSSEDSDELKESVKQKWIAKNKLERLEAERRISVLQSNDVYAEVKRYRTRVGVQTERNMVAMEKAHATLKATGNVPRDHMDAEGDGIGLCGRAGVVEAGSRVCTLVTDKSGSISPDSSASQAEFRAVQKKSLDQEAQILEMKQMIKQFGVSYEALKKADQMTFTDNTENGEIMDELYPKGIGCHFVDRGGVSKLRIGCEDY